MKTILILIIIFSNYFLLSKGQPEDDGRLRPLSQNVVIRNFKPDRSPDFGIPLSPYGVVPGIMQNQLGPDKRPQYCCGDAPFTDQFGDLLVHNQETFNTWWNGDGNCTNYLTTFEINLDVWDPTVQIGSGGAFDPLDGRGFGNPIEFPQYASDPFNQYYCFELHFSTIATDIDYDVFRFSILGEMWVFFNDSLVFDSGGDTSGFGASVNFEYSSIPGLEFDGTTVYPLDIYACLRSTDQDAGGSPFNLQSQANLFCSWIDDAGVCNGNNITICVEDEFSCLTKTELCGNCILGLRTCDGEETLCTEPKCLEGSGCQIVNKTCNNDDPCLSSTCDETNGCTTTTIPNCHCNSTNCITTDLCEPRSCQGELCIANPIDCSLILINCGNPFCNNGECFCTFEPTTQSTTTPSTGLTTSTIGTTASSSTTYVVTTASTTSVVTTASTTYPVNVDHTKCDPTSCPHHYCCIQLHRSFTCVSKQFEEKCEPERLVLY